MFYINRRPPWTRLDATSPPQQDKKRAARTSVSSLPRWRQRGVRALPSLSLGRTGSIMPLPPGDHFFRGFQAKSCALYTPVPTSVPPPLCRHSQSAVLIPKPLGNNFCIGFCDKKQTGYQEGQIKELMTIHTTVVRVTCFQRHPGQGVLWSVGSLSKALL